MCYFSTTSRALWSMSSGVHINLCVISSLVILSFAVRGDLSTITLLCTIFAVLKHYFLTVELMWILVDGIVLLLLSVISKFKHKVRYYILGFTVLAYGELFQNHAEYINWNGIELHAYVFTQALLWSTCVSVFHWVSYYGTMNSGAMEIQLGQCLIGNCMLSCHNSFNCLQVLFTYGNQLLFFFHRFCCCSFYCKLL